MPRTVLVTGASRGIGAAIARRFAQEGDRVYANYFRSGEQANALAAVSENIIPVRADISDPAQVQSLAETCGEIDVLVNNAGIALPQKLLQEVAVEEFDRLFGVNVRGMFLVTRALLPGMIRRRCGCILNLSSVWGIEGGSCEVAYSAAKAAVIGFSKALAKEVGPSGIRVNCIAPGVIDTEMNAALGEEGLAALAEETPLGRIGTPEEIAETAFFLAGAGAAFITGQVLSPNGGFCI
jgi:3-oxoacyl-[acyl-carrier protein] reductase